MYASLKRNVLRCLLKQSTEDEARMSSGSEFHRKGPALTKARSPDVFPRVYGTSRRPSYQISTNSNQGRRELGWGPGRQIFFRGPYFKIFLYNNNLLSPPPPVDNFSGENFSGRERCNCYSATLPQILIPNFANLPPKNKYLALCAEIFHQKMIGAQQNISRGPHNLGTLPPLPPPSRRL